MERRVLHPICAILRFARAAGNGSSQPALADPAEHRGRRQMPPRRSDRAVNPDGARAMRLPVGADRWYRICIGNAERTRT